MTIEDAEARLISTIVVWIAAGAMFIFGFSKINAGSDALVAWGVVGLALAISPAIATWAIWQSKADDLDDDDVANKSPEPPPESVTGA